jgi:hypothetical protein
MNYILWKWWQVNSRRSINTDKNKWIMEMHLKKLNKQSSWNKKKLQNVRQHLGNPMERVSGVDKNPSDSVAWGGDRVFGGGGHTQYKNLLWVLAGWFSVLPEVFWIPCTRSGSNLGCNCGGSEGLQTGYHAVISSIHLFAISHTPALQFLDNVHRCNKECLKLIVGHISLVQLFKHPWS